MAPVCVAYNASHRRPGLSLTGDASRALLCDAPLGAPDPRGAPLGRAGSLCPQPRSRGLTRVLVPHSDM
eukprot:scaffold74119_cov74-Phaeocystis_antarctica.AAC.1